MGLTEQYILWVNNAPAKDIVIYSGKYKKVVTERMNELEAGSSDWLIVFVHRGNGTTEVVHLLVSRPEDGKIPDPEREDISHCILDSKTEDYNILEIAAEFGSSVDAAAMLTKDEKEAASRIIKSEKEQQKG